MLQTFQAEDNQHIFQKTKCNLSPENSIHR